jgi:hypothetical protein
MIIVACKKNCIHVKSGNCSLDNEKTINKDECSSFYPNDITVGQIMYNTGSSPYGDVFEVKVEKIIPGGMVEVYEPGYPGKNKRYIIPRKSLVTSIPPARY